MFQIIFIYYFHKILVKYSLNFLELLLRFLLFVFGHLPKIAPNYSASEIFFSGCQLKGAKIKFCHWVNPSQKHRHETPLYTAEKKGTQNNIDDFFYSGEKTGTLFFLKIVETWGKIIEYFTPRSLRAEAKE